ncbi:hypothetical protein PHSY_004791 [Pseudozyma hubeiensis SY62]|uniref:Uncharacterized protein n=1 Tax=Pseudozyma hubeiensis (strain SY62) TaxID=1305764 RepID=R9P774_PSEHS|nr:hypothetical protein PHSY_004791 [Pseudozyma hubeiensis SY62]GAC97206.1 hypothetical protein PHSY_004791 [Pseudozyma hubeiensis SY62]
MSIFIASLRVSTRPLSSDLDHPSQQGSCMSSPSDGKKMKRTDTNPGKNNTELHRTTSSYQGSVADGMRYSDRAANAERERLTASQLHKSKTLEERIKQAERENKNRH